MVAKGCKGTNRRRPAVREIPSAVRSSEKEQSSLCEVATIEDADTVLLTTFSERGYLQNRIYKSAEAVFDFPDTIENHPVKSVIFKQEADKACSQIIPGITMAVETDPVPEIALVFLRHAFQIPAE